MTLSNPHRHCPADSAYSASGILQRTARSFPHPSHKPVPETSTRHFSFHVYVAAVFLTAATKYWTETGREVSFPPRLTEHSRRQGIRSSSCGKKSTWHGLHPSVTRRHRAQTGNWPKPSRLASGLHVPKVLQPPNTSGL